jgi:uncharacterized membrane protein
MAGIGFTMRRMLRSQGLGGPMRAFGYAVVIGSGPWLSSSLAMAILASWSATFGGSGGTDRVFLAIVAYCFAFSLIGVGACQMVACRFLADCLFERRWDDLAPSFVQLLVPLLLVQSLIAWVFLQFVPVSLTLRVTTVVLYAALNATWLVMVFLSAAHDYRRIAQAFGMGLLVSVVAGVTGGAHWGLTGKLIGFTFGNVIVFFALLQRLDREFGWPVATTPRLWAYFRKYWQLVVVGFAYNLGVWIDKILFWYQPGPSEQAAGLLRIAPVYDNAIFLAFLSILPAVGLFLLKVETDFYDAYRGYFSAVAARDSLSAILAAKARMVASLKGNLGLLLKIQGLLTVTLVLFTPEVMRMASSSWASTFVFRIGLLGAFFHVLHLSALTLLLYFDDRSSAMYLALTFLVTNGLFTWVAFYGGLPAYGYGYAVASAVTLVTGLWLLDRAVRNLEWRVFMDQPL